MIVSSEDPVVSMLSLPDIADIAATSYDTPSVRVPTCPPDVTEATRVPDNPAASLQATAESDIQALRSTAEALRLATDVMSVAPMLAPDIVTAEDPVAA